MSVNYWTSTLTMALLVSTSAWADFRPDEPNLYSSGFTTAEVLDHKEWEFAAPIGDLLAYGFPARTTFIWDYLAILSGVPSFALRHQFASENGEPKIALELNYTYYYKKWFDQRRSEYQVGHDGTLGWLRAARTSFLAGNWKFHIYAGASFMSYQDYLPYLGTSFAETVYLNHWSPDAGLSLEWQINSWSRLHLSYQYGMTFLYSDLTAIKEMAALTWQIAPFSVDGWAFFRNMRMEFNLGWEHVPDANYNRIPPFSPLPFIYWQWIGD